MSARDVIEAALTQKGVVGVLRADYVSARLTAAGYRILGPDEVDPRELQRYIDRCIELSSDGEYSWWTRLAEILAALKDNRP